MNSRKLLRRATIGVAILFLAGCQLKQSSSEFNARQAAESRLELGLAYLEEGHPRMAKQNLERALMYAPEDYRTQLGMALYMQKSGESVQAERYYQNALRIAPQNGTIMNNYGAFLCGLGQYVAAQQQFDNARETHESPEVAGSYMNSGDCYLKEGQLEKARTVLSQAVRHDEDTGRNLLAEADNLFIQKDYKASRLLLEVYQQWLAATADSLWLQIRFAALDDRPERIKEYGRQLEQFFPQSQQYQHYLAHEY